MQSMHASLSTTQLQLMHRQSQCSIDLTHDGTMQGIEIYTLINTASMHHFVREWKKNPICKCFWCHILIKLRTVQPTDHVLVYGELQNCSVV